MFVCYHINSVVCSKDYRNPNLINPRFYFVVSTSNFELRTTTYYTLERRVSRCKTFGLPKQRYTFYILTNRLNILRYLVCIREYYGTITLPGILVYHGIPVYLVYQVYLVYTGTGGARIV